MESNLFLIGSVVIIGLVSLIGYFVTKNKGFGKFNTSTLLMLMVLNFSVLIFLFGKFDIQYLMNLMFAIIGFAGGLFVNNKSDGSTNS